MWGEHDTPSCPLHLPRLFGVTGGLMRGVLVAYARTPVAGT